MKARWYTNGALTIKVRDGDIIPEGFTPGRSFKANPWNKGLTKQDDERLDRVSSTSFKKGHKSWNEGLTKESNQTLQKIARKVSEKNRGKQAWNKGVAMTEEAKAKLSANHNTVPYNKGLTKTDHPSVASASEKLKGHEVKLETILKGWDTKHKNHTCNSSQPEEDLYVQLCNEYGKDQVFRNYKDDPRYPHPVDFYIKSEDLFIELNLFWMHNDHPFNENSEADRATLSYWKQKALTSMQYQAAIKIWSQKDVKKLQTARDNHLNFQMIYKNLTISS